MRTCHNSLSPRRRALCAGLDPLLRCRLHLRAPRRERGGEHTQQAESVLLGAPQLAGALAPPLPPGSVANCVTNSVQTTESPLASHRTAQDGGRSPRRPKSPILRLDTPGTPLRREVSVAVASLYELGGVSFVVACLGFVPASTLGISASPTPAPLTRVGQGLALALASPGPGPSIALALAP